MSPRPPSKAASAAASGATGVPRLTFVLPGDPETRTGGYHYDRRIIDGLRARGWDVAILRLGDGFPFPTGTEAARAAERLEALPSGQPVVVDGLAGGVLPVPLRRLSARAPVVALVHHPLAEETGLDAAARQALAASEKAGLAYARRVVATGPATAARLVRDYAVPEARLGVVIPGTDPAPPATGSGDPPLLLTVAALSPRKGHAVLVEALRRVADRAWRADFVGSTTRDPACGDAVRRAIVKAGLETRIDLVGELSADALSECYARADLFVLPSLLEGFGMVLTEALARGLPIVATTAPAIPDTVPPDAGLLVAPDDPAALAGALARVLDDPALAGRLRSAAREARRHLADWTDQVARFEAELEKAARP